MEYVELLLQMVRPTLSRQGTQSGLNVERVVVTAFIKTIGQDIDRT
jgi:hypothetical protein